MPNDQTLARRVAELVQEASEGTLSPESALTDGNTLAEKGLSSLSYLRLIDSIETEFGIYIDLEGDTTFMQTIPGIVAYMAAEGVAGAA
ncbi:acyl carrier protein [Streptomyces sp. NPDC005970]|uniref:acyl carrier protein n=1 Tax=Streptomyces sp. NPDC005970 TaxID=3156723 RepID=UPI00340BB1BF